MPALLRNSKVEPGNPSDPGNPGSALIERHDEFGDPNDGLAVKGVLGQRRRTK